MMQEEVVRQLQASARLKTAMAETLADDIAGAARMVADAFKAGGKVLIVGNGGSAADAQHIAGELVGRFRMDRAALPAIALTTDTSVLTSVANDSGYDNVFRRQLEALAAKGDILLAISTSGRSPGILKAMDEARSRGVAVIALTGKKGGGLRDKADLTIIVPSDDTPRIQEAHITIGHIICHLVEREMFRESN
ncbi:MAG TPA: D-sedoheptulose 7-phosphate isomerase [Dehalococcoidales bacterium]|nr:D-sedoheptulose 7-phosphate isomerase [Dehalococcoidales bacterium]